MFARHAPRLRGALKAIATSIFMMTGPILSGCSAEEAPRWEAVNADISVGTATRLEVRLIGADATAVTVTATRLDMGPDGMAMMDTPLTPVTSDTPGVFAYEADVSMAGRWGLTISAIVAGRQEPVEGVIVFTASEKRSEAAPPGERKIRYYRNPMGLPDVSDVPKQDSMGMDYIPVYEDEAGGSDGSVRISPEKIQRAGVTTMPVELKTLTRTIRGFGMVAADESRLAMLTARFDGFVEKVFVPVTGGEVKAGAPLVQVWISSVDLLQKQADYLSALKGGGRGGDPARAAANLRAFGFPDAAIASIRDTGAPVRSIVLTADAGGTVIQREAVPGMRFADGEMLFMVADLSLVWITAEIAERDLGDVSVGQDVEISLPGGDGTVSGTVAFIASTIDPETRTGMIRIDVLNADRRLRVGQLAEVRIAAAVSAEPVLAVPDTALIDDGARRIVLVAKEGGLFEPRPVTTGGHADGFWAVTSGLAAGEQVVVRGNFLIDAESNLTSALVAFTPPAAQP